MDSLENQILFDIAIIMLLSLVCGRIVKHLKMPNVTGYLIAGLLLGPCCFNIITADMVSNFGIASDIALGFIAFAIGSEFKLSYFKKVGAAPIVIACFESFGAVAVVLVTCIILGFSLPLSILLSAISAATAPAQTIMVVRQYNAKGPMTSMLMSVVAIDDATALIAFGFATSIVKSMESGNGFSVVSAMAPVLEVAVSFVLGLLMSCVMMMFMKFFKKDANRLCIAVGVVLMTVFLSDVVDGSSLLACMALGAFMVNLSSEIDGMIKVANNFTPPINVLFFAISGAGFAIGELKSIGLIGVVYVVTRVIGKMVGAYIGGRLTKQDKNTCKYLGPTLMPQAGVALGLIMVAQNVLPQYGPLIRTVILCSTFIYSILGPSVAKWALTKAGEIHA